jgi:phospholipase/carboxylesterase
VSSPPLQLNVVGSTGPGTRLLLLVHGFGADEHDLAPLAPLLDPDGRFFTVCPRGPLDAMPGAGPYGGASWYHFTQDGADPATMCGSLIALDHSVDAICAARGLDRRQAVFAGFSQGGSMALALALRASTKPRPAAVACLSGFLHRPDWLVYAWSPSLVMPGHGGGAAEAGVAGLPPVYVQHGTYDPLLPIERGRDAAAALRQHGLRVTWHEYPMQHEISPESIVDLRAFLREV